MSCSLMQLAGGYRFGSLHKATGIPLPGELRDSLEATHLFIPADCSIDGTVNQAFGLVRIDAADLSGMVLKEGDFGREGFQIEPDMFEGPEWDAFRYFVNLLRYLLDLEPMTAESMYTGLVEGYEIPAQEAAQGKWRQTPVYTNTGRQEPLYLYSDDLSARVAGPIIPLIKTPITLELQGGSSEIKRYDSMEVLITLDDDYFHHLGTDDKGMLQKARFDAYDADNDGERIIVDARFRLVNYETGQPTGEVFDVPCFCMKDTANGPFEWKVRFSPPYDVALVWGDVDGDGTWDTVAETDVDGDGHADVLEDVDGDGHHDVQEDTNGNGVWDEGEVDVDGDGHPDVLEPDVDGDGNADVLEDLNGDGNLDVVEVADDPGRSAFGNHAFAMYGGHVFDATGGPALGTQDLVWCV